jgi:FG-GAP-like repeat/FG-GAP repeat
VAVTERGVCWSTTASPTIANSHSHDGSGLGAFTSAITSLAQNTTYNLRAYATNASGTVYGTNLTFTTLRLAPTVDFNFDGFTDLVWRNTSNGKNAVWYIGSNNPEPPQGAGAKEFGGMEFVRGQRPVKVYRSPIEAAGGDIKYQPPVRKIDLREALVLLAKSGSRDIIKGRTEPQPGRVFSTPMIDRLMAVLPTTGSAYLDTVNDAAWKIVGTGDFNGDGKVDILWRNTSNGQNVVWYMNGITYAGAGWLDTVNDASWTIAGTGDFNSDGKIDILWRNTSNGQNVVWYLNGVTYAGAGWLDPVNDASWVIGGTDDFNGDGKVDILWRNTSNGKNCVWFLNGVTYTGAVYLDTVNDAAWKIDGTGDFNADGKTDIIWRNYTTGRNVVWYFNGTTYIGYDDFSPVTDVNWKIVNR